ncbi:MAG: AbrB family transcriptional regulator [Gammaproteobacteria bacterium HGW-Gammaproteobacteria-4]|jgi:AbrB family looped-hinge helix DNA binding protein|nr:MAG: AbrB family transcriptional regulator [Gammaproteobacteria bacterium HGW-Gammaproteobacteria-4]
METTKLSSKGQVIIPKAFRARNHWEAGLELQVIAAGDGVLLKPKAPFEVTALADVAGLLKGRIKPMTDAQIAQALQHDARRKWRGSR